MPQRIHDAGDERVVLYQDVRDASLIERHGLFMAEGRLVVELLLGASRHTVRSVFLSEHAADAMADTIGLAECRGIPVFIAEQRILNDIAGFDLHRGCLALGERGAPLGVPQVLGMLSPQRRAVLPILEAVTNHDNVGGAMRVAAAFGAPALLSCPRTADPLYRKAIRVSMGHALRVPHARLDHWPQDLDRLTGAGVRLVAMTTDQSAEPIETVEERAGREQWGAIGILIGAEGDGLTPAAMQFTTARASITMVPGVDSLNAVTALAIVLHRLARPSGAARQ
ncbi:MAG: RNA methyltransferase [Planctomycetota bacterium]